MLIDREYFYKMGKFICCHSLGRVFRDRRRRTKCTEITLKLLGQCLAILRSSLAQASS